MPTCLSCLALERSASGVVVFSTLHEAEIKRDQCRRQKMHQPNFSAPLLAIVGASSPSLALVVLATLYVPDFYVPTSWLQSTIQTSNWHPYRRGVARRWKPCNRTRKQQTGSTTMRICVVSGNGKSLRCAQNTRRPHIPYAHDFTEELPVRLDHSFLRYHNLWLGFRSEVRTCLQDLRQYNNGKGHLLTTSSTVTYGLANGGTGGLLVIYLLDFFGILAVVMCLAEMSSMWVASTSIQRSVVSDAPAD